MFSPYYYACLMRLNGISLDDNLIHNRNRNQNQKEEKK